MSRPFTGFELEDRLQPIAKAGANLHEPIGVFIAASFEAVPLRNLSGCLQRGEDLATLVYTSGTTGNPKVCPFTRIVGLLTMPSTLGLPKGPAGPLSYRIFLFIRPNLFNLPLKTNRFWVISTIEAACGLTQEDFLLGLLES